MDEYQKPEIQLNEEDLTPVVVPFDQLQPATLRALAEDFVTRDGAVHGHRDSTMDARADAVIAQLRAGKIVVMFDPTEEQCVLVKADQVRA